MTCHNCRIDAKRHGRDRKGKQRYQCAQCSKTFLEPQDEPLDGMYLPIEKAEMVLRLLLEGNSVSSTSRLTDIHVATILKLLVKAGEKCEKIMGQTIRTKATATRSLRLSATPSWCSTLPWVSAIRPRRTN